MDKELQKRIEQVQQRIEAACRRCGRNPAEVKLIAVSKTVPVERIRDAAACGLRCFGENYVQEALPKIRSLDPSLEWHFVGHLQRNKVKQVLGSFRLIHSVDRLSLIQEIDRRALRDQPVEVLLQVNLSGETSKSGASPQEIPRLMEAILSSPHLRLRGLMTMPPFFDNPEMARPYFRSLRQLRDRLLPLISPPHSLQELSMGMTGDFHVAIEEGATMIRIGTAIFGPRLR
jgi:hypothetical protein